MASTKTSCGFLKPAHSDTGATFFDDCNTDIQQINDHTHDGANSSPLAKTQTIGVSAGGSTSTGTNSGWADDGTSTNTYVQTIALPTKTIPNTGFTRQMQINEVSVHLRDSLGEIVFNRVVPVVASSVTYKVYSNDNALVLTAIYI